MTRMLVMVALGLGLVVPGRAAEYHSYPGAIHIHSEYSDGSGTFAEITAAAKAAGLRYIITTDHNTLQPIRDGHQRYWDDLLVLVGTEISTDVGHCLAVGVPVDFDLRERDAQGVIDRINAAGGISILAHPLSPRWRWENWNVTGYTGFEIVNLSSLVDADLRAAAHATIPTRVVGRLGQLVKRYVANPDALMKQLTNATVDTERTHWDRYLAQGRQVLVTGAVDAHARVPVGGQIYRVPSYQEAFESVQTYVVTLAPLQGHFDRDREQIYRAYRNGRAYVVYPRVAAAPKFRFTAHEGNREATMGQPIRKENRVRLTVEAPDHNRPLIRLLRDGVEVAAAESDRLEYTTATGGAYRVEVYARERSGSVLTNLRSVTRGRNLRTVSEILNSNRRELRPWIFSNPIYVRG